MAFVYAAGIRDHSDRSDPLSVQESQSHPPATKTTEIDFVQPTGAACRAACLGNTQSAAVIKGLEETMSGLAEERALRNRLLGQQGLEITLPQAGHLSFTDLPLYSPILKPLAPDSREQHRLINEHTLRFLQELL